MHPPLVIAPLSSPSPARRARRLPTRFASTLAALAALAALAPWRAASAQGADTAARTPAPLFTRHDAVVAGGIALASAVLFRFDREITDAVRDSAWLRHTGVKRTAAGLAYVNEKSALFASVGLYAVGRVGRMERVADLGLHSSEAVVFAIVASSLLKNATGRARPFVDPTNPYLFKPGRGFRYSNYRSFPSLHEAGSWAAAAALVGESRRWGPRASHIAGPLAYGTASLVGLARIYEHKHWPSDILIGAALGAYAGSKVVRYHHAHPGNRVDRWLLRASLASEGAAPLIVVSRRF